MNATTTTTQNGKAKDLDSGLSRATPIVGEVKSKAMDAPPSAPRTSDANAAARLSDLVCSWFGPEPVGARSRDRQTAVAFGGSAIAGYLKCLGAYLKSQNARLSELDRLGASNPRANIALLHPDGITWPDGRKSREMNGVALAQALRRDDLARKAAAAFAKSHRS